MSRDVACVCLAALLCGPALLPYPPYTKHTTELIHALSHRQCPVLNKHVSTQQNNTAVHSSNIKHSASVDAG
jgi:hypothetical protein